MADDFLLVGDVQVPQNRISPIMAGEYINNLAMFGAGISGGAVQVGPDPKMAAGGNAIQRLRWQVAEDAVAQSLTSTTAVDSVDWGNTLESDPIVNIRSVPHEVTRAGLQRAGIMEPMGVINEIARGHMIKLASDVIKKYLEYVTTALRAEGTNVHDQSAAAGGTAVSAGTSGIVDAQNKLGDMAGKLRFMVLHSQQWTDLKDSFTATVSSGAPPVATPTAEGILRTGLLPNMFGMNILVDDQITTVAAVASSSGAGAVPKKYRAILLGVNQSGLPGSGIRLPTNLLAGGLNTSIFNRNTYESESWRVLSETFVSLWMLGTSFDAATTNPTDANLTDTTKYTDNTTNTKEYPGVVWITN